LPSVIYPGQEVTINVKATDYADQPVKGLDITGQSFKSTFNSSAPSIPHFPEKSKSKDIINAFTLTDSENQATLSYDFSYDEWKNIFGLDSMRYYTTRNPVRPITKLFEELADSVTQFTPIIVKDGKVQRVSVVKVDEVPVYFDFVKDPLPYAFRVEPNKPHHLYFRLFDQEFSLSDISFQEGGKTKLIIDVNKIEQALIIDKQAQLTYSELHDYIPYLFRYKNIKRSTSQPYIEQGDLIVKLKQGDNISEIGPVSNSFFEFNSDAETYKLTHEASFEYEFLSELVKMRTKKGNGPFFLNREQQAMPLNEYVITKQKLELEKQQANTIRIKQSTYDNLNSIPSGGAKLVIQQTEKEFSEQILYTILFDANTDNDFVFLRGGEQSVFSNIPAGNYQLYYLTETSNYTTPSLLNVKDNGINFFRIKNWEIADEQSVSTIKTMLDLFQSDSQITAIEEAQLIQTVQERKEFKTYDGPTKIISGQVVDSSGEPLIGASIFSTDYNTGTITDINGEYVFAVPISSEQIEISYVGYTIKQFLLIIKVTLLYS